MAERSVQIAPAVLAATPAQYEHDLQVATSVSSHIQIDVADGQFAPNRTVNLEQTYWPEQVRADIHVMYNDPASHLETLVALGPHLAIIHFESEGLSEEQLRDMSTQLRAVGVQFGLALLPPTPVEAVHGLMSEIDHALIFTGELGHYGGEMQAQCLNKIGQLKQLQPDMEVGVDGGIDDTNVAAVVRSGADVLNVGSYIQRASRPQEAYATLQNIISDVT